MLLASCATPSRTGGGSPLPPATKENPFVNSLGMKFVPVPGTNILMCTTETTVAQYKAAGTGYPKPPFEQDSSHPAVNINWYDANAWCAWLSRIEGRKYRLPTFSEWSAAVGSQVYPWGNSWPPHSHFGNYAGQEMRDCTEAEQEYLKTLPEVDDKTGFTIIGQFQDRHKFTAPVGSYPANRLGLYDLGGNVWEWSLTKAASVPGCSCIRGASYLNDARKHLLCVSNSGMYDSRRLAAIGFRCVVER